ncbi:MAG: M1 family peptidase, partial [Bacteroidota bacterium]
MAVAYNKSRISLYFHLMKTAYSIFFLLCLGHLLAGQSTQALSDRIANYHIKVELDTAQRMLFASTDLRWHNPSKDTIRELQFHIYYHAFKNNQSTFLKEAGGIKSIIGKSFWEDCAWGATKITSIRDQYDNDLTDSQTYIQPDDDNEADQTVLRLLLKEPVLPYDSIQLDMQWQANIPKLLIRTGYNQDYYFMAQWFPKLGVYEPAGMRFAETGQWNCHQYHLATEYYANFGTYEVEITTPKGYVVGGSGKRIKTTETASTQTLTYRANDVIDFAWTAYPNFIEVVDNWEHVTLRLLRHPDRSCLTERYLTSAKYALEYMDKYVGKYPYSVLTIV